MTTDFRCPKCGERIEPAKMLAERHPRTPRFTAEQIEAALEQANGNKSRAAEILGCSWRTIHRHTSGRRVSRRDAESAGER